MEGLITSFRRGLHTMTGNQMVISVKGVSSKDKAKELVGKKVIFECEGKLKKIIVGKISSPHGNNGAVRAIFETGMPGQAVSKKVKIE